MANKKKSGVGSGRKHTPQVSTETSADASSGKDLFPVVALGASAGGLEAFEQFFKNLPQAIKAAFVVISHLDPKHTSMMSELIGRFTSLAVHEASDGSRSCQNCSGWICPLWYNWMPLGL